MGRNLEYSVTQVYPTIMTKQRKSRSTQKSPSKHNSNTVRIIAGDWRGRKLTFPSIAGLRPSGDRMRETLFNWLAPYIGNAAVLDLFAGSGSLGFEALSRGAASATFVEANPSAAASIKANLQTFDAKNADVYPHRAEDFIQSALASVDIVFIDPPFSANLHNQILAAIHKKQLISPSGLIYIEAPKDSPLELPQNWIIRKDQFSGQVRYLLCQN